MFLDHVRLVLDGGGERQDGVVVRGRVALPGPQGGAQPLLGVRPCLGVASGAQLGVGEVLQGAGHQRGRALLPGSGQGPCARPAGRLHLAQEQRGGGGAQQRLGRRRRGGA
ncbi:hypothetical protein GA0115236_13921, partial [Streptomyces sp. IgraMP-1]